MFNQIGKKLQTLAIVFLVLGFVGGAIMGVHYLGNNNFRALICFVLAVFGSWLLSSLIYALGTLVETSEANSRYLLEIQDKLMSSEEKKNIGRMDRN